jgi:hypothetical protein
MALVTANIHVMGVPLRRTFIEHTDPTGLSSLGWTMTDNNGSFTFDAGPFSSSVDIKIHCQNSVVQVLNAPMLSVPIDIHVSVGNGHTLNVENTGHNDVLDHFRILAKCQDVYDTVWRQFRPYDHSDRGDFPLGRPSGDVKHVYDTARHVQLNYPALLQSAIPAILTFVEPDASGNAGFPLMHIQSRSIEFRVFEEDATTHNVDPMIIPHEFGHAMHFSAVSSNTRANFEVQYIGFLATHATNAFHNVNKKTTPFVAFVEAVGIFSERFFFFKKLVRPELDGVALRQAFFEDELDHRTLQSRLHVYIPVGTRTNGVITPALQGNAVEGAVYGAIYLDFARRVGLRDAVGLVIDSQATNFDEFHTYVAGRGNATWLNALNQVRGTWGL